MTSEVSVAGGWTCLRLVVLLMALQACGGDQQAADSPPEAEAVGVDTEGAGGEAATTGANGAAGAAVQGSSPAAGSPAVRFRALLRGQERTAIGARVRDLTEQHGTLSVEDWNAHTLLVEYEDTAGRRDAPRFTLELAAPQGEPLGLGLYAPAWDNPEPGDVGLSLRDTTTLSGRGGSAVSGWFEILELERAPTGEVVRLAVDFEHRSHDQRTQAAIGQVRYRSDRPIDDGLVHAALWLHEEPPVQGDPAVEAPRIGRPDSSLAIDEATPGKVAFTISEAGRAPWTLSFATGRGEPLELGMYQRAASPEAPKVDRPLLAVGRAGCGEVTGSAEITGWFEIRDLRWSAAGVLERFAAGFRRTCVASKDSLRGEIHWNSDRELHPALLQPKTPRRDSGSRP